MPQPRLDFYFDYVSGYAYFAWMRLPEICARYGADLVLHPVLFAGLLNHGRQLGPAEVPAKRVFTFIDWMRLAQIHGIPFRGPKAHPFNPLAALRVSLWEVAGDHQAVVIDTLFKAAWAQGRDLASPAEIVRALDMAGLDGTALVEKTSAPAARDGLRRETDAAIAHGVFGVPTMMTSGDLFWGFDRLDQVELALQGKLRLESERVREFLARPRGADRKR